MEQKEHVKFITLVGGESTLRKKNNQALVSKVQLRRRQSGCTAVFGH